MLSGLIAYFHHNTLLMGANGILLTVVSTFTNILTPALQFIGLLGGAVLVVLSCWLTVLKIINSYRIRKKGKVN